MEGKGADYEKCFLKKTKTENKTFYSGQTSSFNFLNKNLENTASKPSPPADTVKSNGETCSKSVKSISKEPQYLDMDKYILKTEMTPPPDMSDYVKKNTLNNLKIDKSKYILKSRIPAPSRIPDPNKYILKTQLTPPTNKANPIYKGYNIAGGPLDMTMDYALYPLKSRFNTCSYAKVNKKNFKKKPAKDDNNNEYNPNRLSTCKAQRNIKTPDIFGY